MTAGFNSPEVISGCKYNGINSVEYALVVRCSPVWLDLRNVDGLFKLRSKFFG